VQPSDPVSAVHPGVPGSGGVAQVEQDPAPPAGLRLVTSTGRSLAGETWRARQDDGEEVVATWIAAASTAERGRLLHLAATAAAVDDPSLVPVLSAAPGEGGVWIITPADDGASLQVLLGSVWLSPAQAVAVGRAVLEGLHALHQAGLVHGAVRPGSVRIDGDGRVRLGSLVRSRAGREASSLAPARSSDLAGAEAVFRAALGGSGQRGGRAMAAERARTTQVADLLDAAGIAAAGSAADALRRLVEAAGPLAADPAPALAAEGLAKLVAHVRRLTEGESVIPLPVQPRGRLALRRVSRGDDPEAAALPMAALPMVEVVGVAEPREEPPNTTVRAMPEARPPAEPPAPQPLRLPATGTQARRPPPWLIVAAGVAAVALIAVLVTRSSSTPKTAGPVQSAVPSRAASPAASASATSAPTATTVGGLKPVPVLAPASAGPISAVALELGEPSCAGTPACAVKISVTLGAHADTTVSWAVAIVDRCTGAQTRQPGGDVDASSVYASVFENARIRVQAADHPLALIAVTTAPVAVASPPIFLGPTGC
jgi:hypothetical protein